ncbi:17 beta-hydroxysteroid dehydrogenase type 3, HSD17B3 [Ceraceosorus bombacis]|uniref:17 beta-hydroxysteroid dehydrogenase type 3, HSD17B3 n=1 Tax=Ceraceosorus bombacis TaxID=401625 RepID=A0A0P1BCA0_9BASI|nr:17 beta-hydroxysteroid dehydrogenase type 3, HSD17B3 [Ceraceosorus bombacis]
MTASTTYPPALARYRHTAAPYALITGSTAGMGEAWAYALASHGFNLLLHGRSEEKLSALRHSILSQNVQITPNLDIRYVICDASLVPTDIKPIREAIGKIANLAIVVNNVGGSGGGYDSIEEADPEKLEDEIATNVTFPSLVANATLPKLRQQQPSLMVNVSSISGLFPTPFVTGYSASKAFNRHFSMGIYHEEKALGTQVDVVCLGPGVVVNNRGVQGGGTSMAPLASTWVDNAIKTIAPKFWRSRPPAWSLPHTPHNMAAQFCKWLPESVALGLFRREMIGLRNNEGNNRAGGGSSANGTGFTHLSARAEARSKAKLSANASKSNSPANAASRNGPVSEVTQAGPASAPEPERAPASAPAPALTQVAAAPASPSTAGVSATKASPHLSKKSVDESANPKPPAAGPPSTEILAA